MKESILAYYLTNTGAWGYPIVLLGMFLEGDIVVFTASFLTHKNFFHPALIFLTMLFGVIGGNVLWWWLGKNLPKTSLLQRISEKAASSFDAHLQERTLYTIFFSKFVIGIHHAILMRAGALNIDIKKLMRYDLPSSVAWIGIVGGLGYFSSASFSALKSLRHLELGLLLAVIGFISLERLAAFFLRKSL